MKQTFKIGKDTFEVEVTKNGFVIWAKEGKVKHWLLDGSCLIDDKEIRLGNKIDSYKIEAVFNKKSNSIKILTKP